MPTHDLLVIRVPAGERDAAEALIAPYLDSPNDKGVYTFGVSLVAKGGADDAPPTHFAACMPLRKGSAFEAGLAVLLGKIPGASAEVIGAKQYRPDVHWVGKADEKELKPRKEADPFGPVKPVK